MNHRLAVFAALSATLSLATFSCSADDGDGTYDPSATGGGSGGTDDGGGTGGGAGTEDPGGGSGSGGTAQGVEVCRTYVTAGAMSNAATGTYTCEFIDSPAVFKCSYNDNKSGMSQAVYSYPSALAFVEEAAVVGLDRYTRLLDTSGATVELSYDEQGRLQSRSSGFQYSAWDASGRPTAGSTQAENCTVPLTFSYSESARTMTTTFNVRQGTGSDCPNIDSPQNIDTWDADGNVIAHRLLAGTSEEIHIRYSVTDSAEFCTFK